ncbi:MAG TPA: transcriptional regulator GcvA [Rhizomicrobium sp.]|jgi:LysR family glycine cleavage system transcriptional activator|nr:transcriptional regulator GcvA [Rhizomicrobium sp.]
MANPLPPIASLRAFEAAARHMNFTRAAEELAITQAAVSYQIRLLEERLGTPLFVREPRRLLLTETGAELAVQLREAFDRLRATFESFHREAQTVFSLSVSQTFAANWLVPRLGLFQMQNPSIAVRLDASDRLVDFGREKFDAGVRSGHGEWPGIAAHLLFSLQFTPVCTPSLLKRLGPVKRPRDLLALPLISPADPDWEVWFAAAGIPDPGLRSSDGPSFGVQHLEGKAALTGQGVALVTPDFFTAELRSGQLVQLFDIVADSGRGYWFAYPRQLANTSKLRTFRTWILAQAAEKQPAFHTGTAGSAT